MYAVDKTFIEWYDAIMEKIKLTQNKFTIVDDEDFDRINKFKWYARKDRNTFYAQRKFNINGTWKNIMLHRFILNPPSDKFIDHINHDGLDNRKANLRIVTHSQNHFNEKIRTDNTSGFKGVYWKKQHKRWIAMLANKYLGSFKYKKDAIDCRNFHFNNLP